MLFQELLEAATPKKIGTQTKKGNMPKWLLVEIIIKLSKISIKLDSYLEAEKYVQQ